MSVENECNLASRYRTVRKHLDGLGYRQILPLDSLPLVENILADLIQTTESLKHFKSVAQDNIESCSQLQLAVDPYKCDNARLVQENNELHLELMREKETHQKQLVDLKKRLRRIESEHGDLQLSSSRNLQRIKDLESESANKSKKILELQGKCCKPLVNNVPLASKKRSCYPLRRPVLECEVLPRTKSSPAALQTSRKVEPYVVDFVAMADHRMNCLNHELALKEKEIFRLRKMLEGGRPYNAVSKECSCKKSEKSQNSRECCEGNELKILQQAKCDLERQLKEALNKQHEAMSQALKLAERNEELEKELRDIDHIALAVEADCNSAVKENNRRVCRLQEKLEDVMTQVHLLENELTEEKRKAQELKIDLDASRLEKLDIQQTLELTLDEKKRLMDRINQLTVIATRMRKSSLSPSRQDIGAKTSDQRNFNQEEEIVKDNNREISNDVQRILYEKESTIVSLQNKLSTLEAERDYFREEFSKFRDKCSKDSWNDNTDSWMQTRELKRQLSEKDRALAELMREKKELCREKFNLEARLQTKSPQKRSCVSCKACKVCDYSPSPKFGGDVTAKAIADRLERERDAAKADVERLVEERDALRERVKMATEAHTSEQRRLRENLHDVETRLKHVERERQELLMTQGTRRATINGLEDQLEDMREELKRTKQELSDQRTQYFQLRALQDQTDQALGDVQGQLSQSETELTKAVDRNRNMEQQQVQLDNQVKELKQEINTLRASMAQLDQEKDQLLMILDEKTERIAALERELQSKEQQAMGVEQQIRELQHRNQICVDQSAEQERQVRSMQIEMDNLQRQLTSSSIDRENAIQENRRLQDDLAAVTCEVRNLQRELDVSRAESFDLKRQLQTYVSEVRRAEDLLNRKENERTEMLNHFRSLSLEATVLENSNHSLETEAAEAKGALQSARDRLMDFERQVADKDCLIRGYESQIADLTQNVATLEAQMRQQEDQKQRAEADLNAVRDLCVKLDQQKDNLMQQLGDKDSLKSQFESQLNRLRTENSVVQDQMSRDHAAIERLEELLDQARQESINTQTSNQELQNEVSRLRQKIADLQGKLSSESSELRRYQNQAAEYSKQVSELRRQVTNERFDRARKEEETRSKETHAICCNRFPRQNNPPNPPNTPSTPQEYNRTTRARQFTWNHSTSRCFQLPAEENRISPGIPVWMMNRFDLKTFSCRCNHCLESRKAQFSLPANQNTVCLQIPGQREQDIRVQIVDMTPENAVCSFEKIDEESEKERELTEQELGEKEVREKELKEKELRDKELREKELRQKELREKELRQKELRGKELRQKELREKELREEELRNSVSKKKELSVKELKEKEAKVKVPAKKKSILSSYEASNSLQKASPSFLKDSSVQTSPEYKNCCESLAKRILQTLKSLEDQPQMRQDVSTESVPSLERNFISLESRSVGTEIYERTFPHLESRDVQSEDTFRNRPLRIHSATNTVLDRTTSGYSSSSQKTWESAGNFSRRLEEEKYCRCCRSEGTSGSRKSSRNLEAARKLVEEGKKKKERKKNAPMEQETDSRPDFDVTGTEFVQVLLEIGEYTRDLEKELAKMNETMKKNRECGRSGKRNALSEPPEIDKSNALRLERKSPGHEFQNLGFEGEEEVWSSANENAKPVGTSTPKSSVAVNEEQNWVSLDTYTGSDLADTQSEAENLDEELRQNENNLSFMATFGSKNSSRHVSTEEENSSLIVTPTDLPVRSSTPNLQEEIPPLKKISLNNSKTPSLLMSKSREVPVSKKSSLNSKNKMNFPKVSGSSVQTQSSNSKINAATSTSSEFLELPSVGRKEGNSQSQRNSIPSSKSSVKDGNSQSERNFRRNSKSSLRSAERF